MLYRALPCWPAPWQRSELVHTVPTAIGRERGNNLLGEVDAGAHLGMPLVSLTPLCPFRESTGGACAMGPVFVHFPGLLFSKVLELEHTLTQ
jgi:hypothetical protein